MLITIRFTFLVSFSTLSSSLHKLRQSRLAKPTTLGRERAGLPAPQGRGADVAPASHARESANDQPLLRRSAHAGFSLPGGDE